MPPLPPFRPTPPFLLDGPGLLMVPHVDRAALPSHRRGPDDPDDVDCAGGSGNGPSDVSGPIRVTGTDVYDLDRDDDGIACE